jgi:(1->4)-alpha-D-glucan 1-alpha-D-glucosylmutase
VTGAKLRAPSVTAEYMLYQTLLGAWPIEGPDDSFVERIQAYALKAAREGKEETSWLNPNEAYEEGLRSFIGRILDPSASAEFLESLARLARRVALMGAMNSLAQLTLKATLPGVPDFYQGTEFWNLSLVDPDNRRPVDFAGRSLALSNLQAPGWQSLARDWPDGRLKLAWTAHLLRLRAELADVFTYGDYQPLDVSGPHRDHVIAFARRRGKDAAVVAVARLFASFSQGGRVWPSADSFDATITLGDLSIDGLDDARRELHLSELFRHLPVAVLPARLQMTAPARKRIRA